MSHNLDADVAERRVFDTVCIIVCYRPSVTPLLTLCANLTSDGAKVVIVDNTEKPFLSGDALPGGCSLTLELADFSVHVRRYWRFAIDADEHAPDDRISGLAEELQGLLDRAVAGPAETPARDPASLAECFYDSSKPKRPW